MAITPRTILTSAAPATVAVVSLYFFTVLGTAAFTCFSNSGASVDGIDSQQIQGDDELYSSTACNHVAEHFGDDRSVWSEYAWINYTYCFNKQNDSKMVVQTADQGLEYYPQSEVLYNLKGYHQIVNNDHAEAIDTLREGMDSVAFHRNGIMANNLAWAGVWEPRKMRLDEARHLYVESLARTPNLCETVHTGLFVEFAIANQSHGLERFDALKRFNDLRNRYNRCLDRLDDGKWMTTVEIVGAAVLFANVDGAENTRAHPLMRSTVAAMERNHGDVDVDSLCGEAMPLADFHHECVDAVEGAIDSQMQVERAHSERNHRAAEVRNEIIEYHRDDLQAQHQGCER